ncbi:MAG: AraC family transcriptional regulator [Cellulomonadaceae bacterium]|jgi:AraC-like DNA-binding protein|nr:AraC family transcriptional regulator [Cellulomonadaceae bacterium]
MTTLSSSRTVHRHSGVAHNPHQLLPERSLGAQRAAMRGFDRHPDAGRSRTTRFGEIVLTYLEHEPVEAVTDDEVLYRDEDTLRFFVVLDGEIRLIHDDATATLGRRDSALILGSAPVAYVSGDDARIVVCDIPADHGSLTAVPRSAPFVVGRAEQAVPCALGAFLVDLLRQDAQRMSPVTRAQVADVLRTLVTSTIMALAVAGCSGWDLRKQRLAALRHIASKYADPELSSASVAEYLGLSRRSLQRLFEDEDRTVAQRIQEVRTQHAVARLKDKRFANVSLGEIATLAGFGSTVAMRRAVQDATGLTPTDLRRKALLPPASAARLADRYAGDAMSNLVVSTALAA